MSVINVHSILEGSTRAEANTDRVVATLTPNTKGKRRNVFRCRLLPGNAIATRHLISSGALSLHLLGAGHLCAHVWGKVCALHF